MALIEEAPLTVRRGRIRLELSISNKVVASDVSGEPLIHRVFRLAIQQAKVADRWRREAMTERAGREAAEAELAALRARFPLVDARARPSKLEAVGS